VAEESVVGDDYTELIAEVKRASTPRCKASRTILIHKDSLLRF
jgi:hypothetical protein